MVLTVTVVSGLVFGAIWGFGKKSLMIFTATWLVAFGVETLFVADSAETAKVAYWALSTIFFGPESRAALRIELRLSVE